MTRAQADRHTRWVRRLRWILPASGLVITLIFIAVSYISSLLSQIDIGPIQLEGTSLIMQKPLLAGFDKQQRAYKMTAEKAKQSITDPKQVELSGPQARMELDDHNWAKLTGEHGIFNGGKEQMNLDGNVRVTSSYGYDMRLEKVDIDMKAGTLVSNTPVMVSQGRNKISSDRLIVTGGGALIRFEGNVRAELRAAPALVEPAP